MIEIKRKANSYILLYIIIALTPIKITKQKYTCDNIGMIIARDKCKAVPIVYGMDKILSNYLVTLYSII